MWIGTEVRENLDGNEEKNVDVNEKKNVDVNEEKMWMGMRTSMNGREEKCG